jgi:hypothetical protein
MPPAACQLLEEIGFFEPTPELPIRAAPAVTVASRSLAWCSPGTVS